MTAPKIVLHWAPQTRAVRVLWALEELGVPYEKSLVDLSKGDQKKPEYLAINPNGKVPAATIDGVPMFESLAMILYLADRFGVEKGLWPRVDDPRRGAAMGWLTWDTVTLTTNVLRMLEASSERVPKEWLNPAHAAAAKEDVVKNLQALEAHLAGSKFIAGDFFSLADGGAFAVVFLKRIGFELGPYPNIARWFEAISSRPAFVRAGSMTA